MAKWTIERLARKHNREGFCCGNKLLDRFLQTLVTQYEKKRFGRTYVATLPDDVKVLGFYTISAGSFALSCLSESERKRAPKHPVPSVHLGRMAVDRSCQGQGLGKALLGHFLATALKISEEIGVCAVDVWAKDDSSRDFYLKYGFISLEDNPLHLWLPIKTLNAAEE